LPSTPFALPVLPVPRQVAVALLLATSPHPSEVARLVRADPAIATRVLSAANSASSSPRQRIVSVEEAIIRLGANQTIRLIWAAVMKGAVSGLDRSGVDPYELWRHSLACAHLTTAAVDPGTSRSVQAASYAAGLLHDVGRIALATADATRYQAVVEAVRAGTDPIEAEREAFGATHIEVGVRVGEAWALPEPILAAIAHHHQPPPDDRLSAAVAEAREAALEIGVGDGLIRSRRRDEFTPRTRTILDRLGGADAVYGVIDSIISAAAA
jgi:HD-like signal output (HDOD) protein